MWSNNGTYDCICNPCAHASAYACLCIYIHIYIYIIIYMCACKCTYICVLMNAQPWLWYCKCTWSTTTKKHHIAYNNTQHELSTCNFITMTIAFKMQQHMTTTTTLIWNSHWWVSTQPITPLWKHKHTCGNMLAFDMCMCMNICVHIECVDMHCKVIGFSI